MQHSEEHTHTHKWMLMEDGGGKNWCGIPTEIQWESTLFLYPASIFHEADMSGSWVFFFLLSFLSGWGIKTISATLEKEKGQFRPAGDNTEEKSGGGKSEHQGIWQGTKYLSPLQNRGRATFSLKFCIYFPRKNSYRILCSSSPDKVFTGQNYCQINFCLYLWYHYCNLFVPQ